MENSKKNLKIIMYGVAVLLVMLICRLGYIQLAGGEELSEAAYSQSLIALEGGNRRGIIYDKAGAALVANKKRYVYIVKESEFDYQAAKIMKNIGASEVSDENKGYYVYSSESYDKEAGEKLTAEYDAYILEASARYSDDQTAANLIGYVNEKDDSGAAGLELMFDEELNGLNRRIYAVADVKGNILPGRGLMITSDRDEDISVKDGISTTLDMEMQKEIEDIAESCGKECAVVVLDARSGDIAAMASYPTFNPNNVKEHIESNGNELINKATQGEYAPGSVFKIVVAAAAIEKGIPQEREYDCKGYAELEGVRIGCETGGEKGHGRINMKEAFAHSCNSYFIQLGREVGYDEIYKMAKKMGFGSNLLEGYPQEHSGHMMTAAESSGAGIGNLSIGQGQMLATPIQVASMTNIIASKGVDRGIHIVMEEDEDERQVIETKTAKEVGEMMKAVTEEGTASYLGFSDEDGNAEAAVKTGTAEYGEKENGKTYGWITGYAPCDDPDYVITVFMGGDSSGASDAGPVYKAILDYLKESGSYSKPALA